MTYDFCGPWCGSAGFNAALKAEPGTNQGNCAASMQAFVNAGASKSKLSMGLAFYGRSWTVASATNGGLYQRGVGTPPGDGNDDGGVYTWRGLRNSAGGILRNGATQPVSPWQRTYRTFAAAPTLFHPTNRWFISYDDPQSMREKSQWAKANGYGGVMVWDISMDQGREMLSGIMAGLA
jgi:GH18 family chitinase